MIWIVLNRDVRYNVKTSYQRKESLEIAFKNGSEETLKRAKLYLDLAQAIPSLNEQCD